MAVTSTTWQVNATCCKLPQCIRRRSLTWVPSPRSGCPSPFFRWARCKCRPKTRGRRPLPPLEAPSTTTTLPWSLPLRTSNQTNWVNLPPSNNSLWGTRVICSISQNLCRVCRHSAPSWVVAWTWEQPRLRCFRRRTRRRKSARWTTISRVYRARSANRRSGYAQSLSSSRKSSY